MSKLVSIVLLFISTLSFCQIEEQNRNIPPVTEPPGVQVAQINIYKLDSFTYEITYYDPSRFSGVEDVHYSVFERVVINNQDYVQIWIENILQSIPGEATLRGKQTLPDSIQNQIMEYYFKIYSKHGQNE